MGLVKAAVGLAVGTMAYRAAADIASGVMVGSRARSRIGGKKQVKVHYLPKTGSTKVACGMKVGDAVYTKDKKRVTCKNCKLWYQRR